MKMSLTPMAPIRLVGIAFFFLSSLACSASNFAETDEKCTVRLRVPLVSVIGGHIASKVEFDGVDFFNRLWIPVLESILVPSDENKFILHSITGEVVTLRKTADFEFRGSGWTCKPLSRGKLFLANSKIGITCLYQNGRLVSFSYASGDYYLSYNGKSTVLFERSGNLLLSALRDEKELRSIEFSGQKFEAVIRSSENEKIFSFGEHEQLTITFYDQLISKVRLKNVTRNFKWGKPIMKGYVKRLMPSAPVVIEDDDWIYEVIEHDGPTTYAKKSKG